MKKIILMTTLLAISANASTYMAELDCGEFNIYVESKSSNIFTPRLERVDSDVIGILHPEDVTKFFITHKSSQDELYIQFKAFDFDEFIKTADRSLTKSILDIAKRDSQDLTNAFIRDKVIPKTEQFLTREDVIHNNHRKLTKKRAFRNNTIG